MELTTFTCTCARACLSPHACCVRATQHECGVGGSVCVVRSTYSERSRGAGTLVHLKRVTSCTMSASLRVPTSLARTVDSCKRKTTHTRMNNATLVRTTRRVQKLPQVTSQACYRRCRSMDCPVLSALRCVNGKQAQSARTHTNRAVQRKRMVSNTQDTNSTTLQLLPTNFAYVRYHKTRGASGSVWQGQMRR